jgi:hypothetical protein
MNGELIKASSQSFSLADPAAVAAAEAARARIQSAYLMALNKPRNIDQARDRILIACRRPVFAAQVEYAKPIGNTTVKGPSIRFAELALREWGNIRSDIQVIYEDEFQKRVRVDVIDLETNAAFGKDLTINKTVERRRAEGREVLGERLNTQGQVVYIVRATEEEIQNKEGAQISKAMRNEGLRLIPQDIIDEALDVARATLKNRDAKDPGAAKKALLDAFSGIGIQPRDIQAFLGHSLDTIAPQELEDLRAMYRAIRDGEARWSDYQAKPAEKAEKPDAPATAPPPPPSRPSGQITQLQAPPESIPSDGSSEGYDLKAAWAAWIVFTESLPNKAQQILATAYANHICEISGRSFEDVVAAAMKPENTGKFIAGLKRWIEFSDSDSPPPQAQPEKAEAKKRGRPAKKPEAALPPETPPLPIPEYLQDLVTLAEDCEVPFEDIKNNFPIWELKTWTDIQPNHVEPISRFVSSVMDMRNLGNEQGETAPGY